jgi:flagellar biosynthesis anti-sigma factor FlgM
MVIDKIGNINNIIEPKKSKSVSNAKEPERADSLNISREAKSAADVSKVAHVVKSTSDVRIERIQELKEKIANGDYNFDDPKIIEMVADKIAQAFLKK